MKLFFATLGRRYSSGEARGRSSRAYHALVSSFFGHFVFAIASSYNYESQRKLSLSINGGADCVFRRIFVQKKFPYLTKSINTGEVYKVFHLGFAWLGKSVEYKILDSEPHEGETSCLVQVHVIDKAKAQFILASSFNFDQIKSEIESSLKLSLDQAADLLHPYMIACSCVARKTSDEIAAMSLMNARLRLNFKQTLRYVEKYDASDMPRSIKVLRQEVDRILAPELLGPHGYSKRLSSLSSDDLETGVVPVFDLITKLGFSAFINSGTLLGAIRDGDLIPHDDDLDIAVYMAGENMEEILAQWRKVKRAIINQFTTLPKGKFLAVVLESGIQVDIFPAWEVSGKVSIFPYAYESLVKDDILPLATCVVRGARLPTPARPTALLQLNYGPNWQKPDPTWKFDWNKAASNFKSVAKYLR